MVARKEKTEWDIQVRDKATREIKSPLDSLQVRGGADA